MLRRTAETGGENLLKGLSHLLADLERGKGQLRIRMTDDSKFRVGENIAVTPGKVVFQNDLMQLIQYAPTTETVLKRPLLIFPPWINKFYILDLRPRELLHPLGGRPGPHGLRRLLGQPGREARREGLRRLHAGGHLRRARRRSSRRPARSEINAIGYCLGGTLLATTLAHMAAKRDTRIKSRDLSSSRMTDFEEAGELGVFIDEEQLHSLEEKMQQARLSSKAARWRRPSTCCAPTT